MSDFLYDDEEDYPEQEGGVEDVEAPSPPVALEAVGRALDPLPVPPTMAEEARQVLASQFEGAEWTDRQQSALNVCQNGALLSCRVGFARLRVQNKATDFGLNLKRHTVVQGFGTRMLVPHYFIKNLTRYEHKLRKLVDDMTIPLARGRWFSASPTAAGGSRWRLFTDHFQRIKDDFDTAVHSLAQYIADGRACSWIETEYAVLAQTMWESGCKNTYRSQVEDLNQETDWSEVETAPPEFVNRVVMNAISRLPSSDTIYRKAVFEYTLSPFHAPEPTVAGGMANSDRELQIALTNQLNEGKAALIDEFLGGVRDALLHGVQGLVESVANSTQGNYDVHGKTVNGVLRSLQKLEQLNVLQDEGINTLLQDVMGEVCSWRRRKICGLRVNPTRVVEELQTLAANITREVTQHFPSGDAQTPLFLTEDEE